MNNIRISSLENYDSFKKVCKYFRLEDEYPGWTGDEKYGIMTDFSEDELLEEFPVIMKALSPYIILNKDYENVWRESISNEKKFEYRRCNCDCPFGVDEETEYHHECLIGKDFAETFAEADSLREAMSYLTELQRSRIEKYFFLGMTCREISDSEGNSIDLKTIWESLQAALKKMKKILS